MRFIQAVKDFFANFQKLETGIDRMFYKHVNTPAWRKFCKAADTFMEVGQVLIDRKMKEIKEATDKDELENNSGEQGVNGCMDGWMDG